MNEQRLSAGYYFIAGYYVEKLGRDWFVRSGGYNMHQAVSLASARAYIRRQVDLAQKGN